MGGFINPRIGSKIESVNHIKAIIVLGCTPTQNIELVFKFNNFMTVPEMLEKKLVLGLESKRNFSSIETNYQSEKSSFSRDVSPIPKLRVKVGWLLLSDLK